MSATADRILVAAAEQEVADRWRFELDKLRVPSRTVADSAALTDLDSRSHLLIHGASFPDDAVETVAALREAGFSGQALVVTSTPSISEAVALMGLGCYDYLPASLAPERVAGHAAEAVGAASRSRAQYELLWRHFRKHGGCEHLYSASHTCQRTYAQAAKAAPSEATVLIEGETGTGKEYLARAIHFMSPRRDKPFIPVNCGAIPETLLESELFGHERGAFTSANRAKPGLCELAHKGTLFLDEIGDMSLPTQVKMLRFLQDRSLVRVGGIESIKVDVRIVAATNQDLKAAVAEGRFREDLYYRLAVMNLHLPPLRDRPEDVLRFARHFLARGSAGQRKTLCEYACDKLRQHSWPGNLRELQNIILRAALIAPHRTIHARHIEVEDPLAQGAPLRLFPLAMVANG